MIVAFKATGDWGTMAGRFTVADSRLAARVARAHDARGRRRETEDGAGEQALKR